MDATPVFSQVKSLFQFLSGNNEGARETQKNFLKLCPVVSQCKSLAQAISGDEEGARETQLAFLRGVNGMVDSMPVVGHVKAAVHLICGDKAGGSIALKAATHTTGVMAGGVGGFLVGGPAGASVGGAIGGACTDVIITALVAEDDAKGYGFVGNVGQIIKEPTDLGNYVDLVGGVVLDSKTGSRNGSAIWKQIKNGMEKRKLVKLVGKEAANDMTDAAESMRKFRSKGKTKHRTPHVITKVKDRVTGKTATGDNARMRQVPIEPGPTELQKRVPGAKQVLSKSVKTCAEQQAYNNAISARPDALPGDLTSATVRYDYKTNEIVTVPRCLNCKEFTRAMGTVFTDSIPETPVPIPAGTFALGVCIGTGLGVAALRNTSTLHSDTDSHLGWE